MAGLVEFCNTQAPPHPRPAESPGIVPLMPVDRVADLLADYEALGAKLVDAEGSSAAAIVRERRLISELLEALQNSAEAPLVDQLADRRKSRTKPSSDPHRRSKPG